MGPWGISRLNFFFFIEGRGGGGKTPYLLYEILKIHLICKNKGLYFQKYGINDINKGM